MAAAEKGTPPTAAEVRRLHAVRRMIFLLLAVAVVAAVIVPFKLPGKPSSLARTVFEDIESLPQGSSVLLSFDFDPTAKGELEPMGIALLRHCFARNLHPVVMTFWQSGVALHKTMVERTAAEYGKVSGRDFVFLGFKPGDVNLILNMGESITGAFDKDYYGRPTQGMPALAGLNSLRTLSYAVCLAAGMTTEVWIAYGGDRFGFPLAAGCTAVIAPDLFPYLQSGQLRGLLGGLRGAADYELLVGTPGEATRGMRPQSVAHLFILGLIALANAEVFAAFLKKRRRF
jgi:hypothetical protein